VHPSGVLVASSRQIRENGRTVRLVPWAPPEPVKGITVFTSLPAASIAAHAGGPWASGPGWLFLLIPLFWIAVLTLIAVFAVRARRAAFAGGRGPGWAQPTRAAESSLAERFAQGAIDEQEYRTRLEVLRSSTPSRTPRKG
jgi:putative membrane protein